jgi:hypothetical protein
MLRTIVVTAIGFVVLATLSCSAEIKDHLEVASIIDGDAIRTLSPDALVFSSDSIQEKVGEELVNVEGNVLKTGLIAIKRDNDEENRLGSRVLYHKLYSSRNRLIGVVWIADHDADGTFEKIQIEGDIVGIPGLAKLIPAMNDVNDLANSAISHLESEGQRTLTDVSTGAKVSMGTE